MITRRMKGRFLNQDTGHERDLKKKTLLLLQSTNNDLKIKINSNTIPTICSKITKIKQIKSLENILCYVII